MDTLISADSLDLEQLKAKYTPYLSEIKRRILWTLIAFGGGVVLGFFFYDRIIKLLIDLLSLKGVNIVFTSPFQFINLAISCGLTTGFVVACPFIIYQLFSFIRPALKPKEYRMVVSFLPACFLLFLIGFGFGFLVMKWQIEIFLSKSVELGIGNILDISHLISTVLLVSVLMGVAFQFPVVFFVLMRIGLIKKIHLRKIRPWVYLGSLIFAILLPPDSILADILLALPLIVLFELTLILNRLFSKAKMIS